MNDYNTAERLMLRIFHELFGERDFKTLTPIDRARLVGHIKILLKPTLTDNQLMQFIMHSWKTDWKMFIGEMLVNSSYNINQVCPIETVVIAGLPGTGTDFLQRFTHNIANRLPQDANSFKPVRKDAYPELYEIQQFINRPKFDIERSFDLITQYKEKYKLKTVVLSVTKWNKHILNWLGYFKDMSVLKLLPGNHIGKHLASRMQHRILETYAPNDPRHIKVESTVQGDFKSSLFNSWYGKNIIHDMTLVNNKADNTYHHWFSTDTFHPTEVLMLEYIQTNDNLFANIYKEFLQEVPGLDQKRKKEYAEEMVNLWNRILKNELNGFNM